MDGELNEPAWARAQRVGNFSQRELQVGEPVSERTEVAVLYDSRSLYIGFWGYDRDPAGIIARRMQRDFSYGSEDNFEIVIDTYDDDRNAFLFITNPNGAQYDALVADNGRSMNSDWDGVWYVAARVTGEGWFAEFELSLSTLKFRSLPEQAWGINFERNIRRKREQVLWQGWSRDSELENVARAGTLTGLVGLTAVHLLETRPYVMSGVERRNGTSDRDGEVGVDVNYQVTPTAKVTGTVNPDFGHLESDRFQVNLTRFSLFYPEKRDFFLEGRQFFSFALNSNETPFYTRRIGLDARGSPQTILGGARFLGKFGGATVGAMSLQTARAAGEEPSTNYTVLRWKQDVLEESTLGFISVTKFQPGRVNTNYGVDFRYATSRFFGDKNFAVGATVAQSYTSDAAARTATAHRLFVSYPSDLVEFDATWNRVGGAYNPEVGYLRRRAYQEFYAELQFNPRPLFLPWVRNLEIKPLDMNYYIDDETHELQSLFTEFRPLGMRTRTGEFIELNIQYLGENLMEDFGITDDVTIPLGRYWFTRYEIQGSTYSGRATSGDFSIAWGDFYDGRRTEVQGGISRRSGKHLSLSADVQRNWVTLPGGRFSVTEVGGRADISVSTKLFGSVVGQWNNEDDRALFNFRLNWIPEPGKDLFLVVNQESNTARSRWRNTGTMVATKLVWRFTF